MVEFKNFFKEITDMLEKAGTEDAEIEAGFIVENVLKKPVGILKAENGSINEKQCNEIKKIAQQRTKHIPLQYLLKEWEFYGIPIEVGEGVLIPRQDSETLIDTCIKKFKNKKNISVIDLCAGSGCLGLALEKHLDCKSIVSIEKSPEAFEYLEKNIAVNGSKIKAVLQDVLNEQTAVNYSNLDIIICNPPYLTKEDMQNLQEEVKHEPETALYGGSDGLDYYRAISRMWKNSLADGGYMVFEVGMGQAQEVSQIMIQCGYENVRIICDLCGVERCVFGVSRSREKKCTAYKMLQ